MVDALQSIDQWPTPLRTYNGPMCMRIGRFLLLLQLVAALFVAGLLWSRSGWALPTALLTGVAVAAFAHVAIVIIEFGLAFYAASPRPAGQQPGIARWLEAFIGEVSASFMTFSVRQPLWGDTPLASADPTSKLPVASVTGKDDGHLAAPGSQRPPIVFIHGFFCNRALWRPAARWFAGRGHVIDSVNLEPVYGSIDQYPVIIDAAVRRLCDRTGQTRVALVCHSMGGLAARAYARDFGLERVARVVTLGTPHRGTFLARFGHGKNVAQMRLESRWLAELARTESSEHRARFTIVLSHHDNIVSPQAAQRIPDARVIETYAKGHVRLALDPDIWQIVADELH